MSVCASYFRLLLPVLPIVAASVAIFVIHHCVSTAHSEGHIPRWLDYPAISTAGIYAPEKFHYTCGFVLLASILWFLEACMSELLRNAISARRRTADDDPVTNSQRTARIAIVGLAVQGAVPLHDGHSGAGLGTFVHVMAANVFYFLSVIHGFYLLSLLEKEDYLPNSRKRCPYGWLFKGLCIVSAFIPMVPAMLLHPGGKVIDSTGTVPLDEEMQIEAAGLSQWWWVGSIIAFFTSYCVDFACFEWFYRGEATASLSSEEEENEEEDEEEENAKEEKKEEEDTNRVAANPLKERGGGRKTAETVVAPAATRDENKDKAS